jgi:GTP cyclohydrolase II
MLPMLSARRAGMDRIETWLSRTSEPPVLRGRLRVSLCYAQSLDGSLTHRRGEPLALSSPASRALTHRLRATHDAILVGIGTVLADDPQLTVRYAPGDSPIPIVLDSRLRLPEGCALLNRDGRPPWIVTTPGCDPGRRAILEAAGGRVMVCPSDSAGRVDLAALLPALAEDGIHNLMVEGGAAVITSFLREGLADQAVITVAPCFIGGLPAVLGDDPGKPFTEFPRLENMGVELMGTDLVVWGELIYAG